MIQQHSSFDSIVLSGEVAVILTEFLDAESAITLTRTCSRLYCGIPRNSGTGIQIWRRYLSNERYISHRLVGETARHLAASDDVSRANYKLILAVLTQKNGFMKIGRLKSLLAAGKLATPLLPRKGLWRDLVRLDQFALKLASKEERENTVPASSSNVVVSVPLVPVKFIARIAGRKGKSDMVKSHLSALLKTAPPADALSAIFALVIESGNFPGLVEVVSVARDLSIPEETISSALIQPVSSFTTAIHDSVLHALVRDPSIPMTEKESLLNELMKYFPFLEKINSVNLNHETPLLLSHLLWPDTGCGLSKLFLKYGADKYICDKKATFFPTN